MFLCLFVLLFFWFWGVVFLFLFFVLFFNVQADCDSGPALCEPQPQSKYISISGGPAEPGGPISTDTCWRHSGSPVHLSQRLVRNCQTAVIILWTIVIFCFVFFMFKLRRFIILMKNISLHYFEFGGYTMPQLETQQQFARNS